MLGGNHGAGGNANGGGEGAQLSSCPQPHAVLSPCLLVSLTRVLVSLTRVVGLMKTGIQWPLLMTSFVTSCLVVRPFPAHLSLSDFSTSAPPPHLLVPQQTTCHAPFSRAPTSATSCHILPFPSREHPSLHPRPLLGHRASRASTPGPWAPPPCPRHVPPSCWPNHSQVLSCLFPERCLADAQSFPNTLSLPGKVLSLFPALSVGWLY